MKKTEIKKMLNTYDIFRRIQNKDVNTELQDLERLEDCVNEISAKIEQRKHQIKKDRVCCSSCKLYFKPNPKKWYKQERIENRTSYTDAGYGDDDRYADYKITSYYELCPKCQKPVCVRSDDWAEKIPGTERDRWGRVYN